MLKYPICSKCRCLKYPSAASTDASSIPLQQVPMPQVSLCSKCRCLKYPLHQVPMPQVSLCSKCRCLKYPSASSADASSIPLQQVPMPQVSLYTMLRRNRYILQLQMLSPFVWCKSGVIITPAKIELDLEQPFI